MRKGGVEASGDELAKIFPDGLPGDELIPNTPLVRDKKGHVGKSGPPLAESLIREVEQSEEFHPTPNDYRVITEADATHLQIDGNFARKPQVKQKKQKKIPLQPPLFKA